MNLKQWTHWEKFRKRGKSFYILVIGGLVNGLITALIVSGITEIVSPDPYWIVRLCIIFPAAALAHMLIAWNAWERKETRFMSTDPPKPQRIRKKTLK